MDTWTDSEVIIALTRQGLDPRLALRITKALERARFLADFYLLQEQNNWAKEEEVKAFLVLPVLLAMGWHPAQIKLEHHLPQVSKQAHADIVCLKKPLRTKSAIADTHFEISAMRHC